MAKKPIIRYFDRGVWYDATVSDIGNLEDLNTVHKTTVVEAINDIIGGNINISGELLEKLTALDNNISRIDGLIASGSLNETQANQMNQFVTNKLNELNQSMEEMNKQRDQRLKEQEEKVAQLKLDSESDKQRIEEITLDLNATKEKLNNAELNVTSVTQLVDEINGKISQAVSKTDFDLLEGTVREQKTLIDQTVEGIKLLATKEELDKSNENVKSIKSALEVQAGLIESKVSSEQLINEIEKIDKYMPNLLRYTRNWQDWENDDEANIDVTLNEYRDCIIQRARGIGKGLSTTVEDLVIGETYSLSVWVKHDDMNAKLYAMVDNVEIIMTDLNSEETFVSNEFKRMRCSFVAQGTTAKVRFIFKDCRTDSYGYLAGAKCEKNKKVSGWQPNSEDVYQSIKSARSEIKQTDGKITTLVETVNKQGDLITSHTTSIEETDKAIKLQAESIKTLDESIESAKAELKVNSDAISSKVWKTDVGEMISDINIDNKNRVLNSDFGDGWELWSETNNLFQLKQIGNYKFAVAERSGLPQNMAIAIATNKFPVKHNERLMFGFYFYCADLSKLDNKIVCALELLDINDIRIDRVDFDVSKLSLENGSFTKLTDTYFVEDERIVKARLRFFLNRNGNVGFALPMAQGGDIKSSDWSLAPEDVARRFNDTNVTITNYEQTVGGFRQTVESYKGSVDGYTNQVSEFNQTVNGFSQTIKDYKESNDKRVQQLETSLTTESGKIEAVVKESAGTKDELGKLTADGGRISQLELTAQGLKSTVASQTSSIQTIQTDTTNAKQLANSAVSTANTAKSNADKAIADVASLTQTVNSQSTRIDQTSSKIDLVASSITEVGNKLDNLKLSDDNLLEKTDTSVFGKGNWFNNGDGNVSLDNNTLYQGRPTLKVDFTQNVGGAKNNQYITLKPDTEYYYSFIVKSNKSFSVGNSIPLHIWMHNTTATGSHVEISLEYGPKTVNANEWTTIVRKFKTPKDYDTYYLYVLIYGLSGLVINVADIQVREGSKYIPWSPSSKDQQSQINGINNNLTNNYYQKTTVDSKLSTAVDGITAQYTQDINTKLGNYYDKSTIDSKLTIDGQGITTYVKNTKSKLDNLQVGGRNLIRKTGEEFVMGYGIPNTTWENGRAILRYGKGNDPSNASSEILPQNGAFDEFVMKRGVAYTQSIIVETDANVNLNGVFNFTWFNLNASSNGHAYKRANAKKIGNERYLIWCTASVDVDNYKLRAFDTHNLKQVFYYYNSGSYIAFSKPKLEEGNTPTAWSPAPEDMATAEQAQQAQNDANNANSKADATEQRVSVAESTIKQLSDSISMMVTDSNGSSMMTQTSDGWTFNIGAITSAIDSATNNIDNLSGSLSQTKSVVNNLNNLANDLSKKTAYINMTTDDTGAPCIELGKTGNAFKVRITNTSVDFIQGSSKIAYVSNQALFIEKAIIKSELQVGEKKGFIWKTRSNGNMGLRWFG